MSLFEDEVVICSMWLVSEVLSALLLEACCTTNLQRKSNANTKKQPQHRPQEDDE